MRRGSIVLSSGVILPSLIISFLKEDALGVPVLILLVGLIVAEDMLLSSLSLFIEILTELMGTSLFSDSVSV